MPRRRFEVPLPPRVECLRCAMLLRNRLLEIPSVTEVFAEWPQHAVVLSEISDVSDGTLHTIIEQAVAEFAGRNPHALHQATPESRTRADRLSAEREAAADAAARARREAEAHAHDAEHEHDHDAEGESDDHEDDHEHEHADEERPSEPQSLAALAAPPMRDSHEHKHGDEHAGHRHDHASEQQELRQMALTNRRRLLFVFASGTIVMLAEIIGGLVANSLVLLADAAHYATDLLAVLLAFFAISWAMKAATKAKTFGYHRAEVIAAFVNALGLWAISIYFVWEAVKRLQEPPEVGGAIVFAVGGLSLVANSFLAWVLHRGSGHNINLRAAYIHILSDVLGSAAALATGAAIYFKGWHVADPILTLFVTVLIVLFTWKLTKQTLHILLEGSPLHADPDKVASALMGVPSVRDVHDLHVWTLTSGVDSVSAHVILDSPPKDDRVSHEIHERLRRDFKINHVTVQVESPDCPCTSVQHRWHPA